VQPELEALLSTLQSLREAVLKKLAGLSEQDARRSTVPSGTSIAGIVQHLTFVESKWFEEVAAGSKQSRGARSMQVDRTVALRALRAEYKAASEASDAIVASIGDAAAPIIVNKKRLDLRAVMLIVINETARHAGHADILREQIDGQVGR
jgi:uncharacterized damage-inducible protein DinB